MNVTFGILLAECIDFWLVNRFNYMVHFKLFVTNFVGYPPPITSPFSNFPWDVKGHSELHFKNSCVLDLLKTLSKNYEFSKCSYTQL